MKAPNQPGLLAAIVESSDDAIVSKDLNGYVTSWNRAAEKLFGYTAEEMIGRHISRIIPDERLKEEDYVIGQVRLGRRVEHFETVRRRKDGSLVEISLSISPVIDEQGVIVGASKIARDVSEQHRLRRELEQASRAKDEFLAMLGHELRNPLAPILTALEIMEMRGAGFEAERALIGRQVTHVVRLVDDLLDVARISHGQVQLRKTLVALAALVAEALETTGPLLEQKHHSVVVDVPRVDELVVDVDAARITQVIANLLSNAAKYTESGGEIHVTAFHTDEDVVLRVRDNGIGLEPRALSTIFESFARERQPNGTAATGLGLGLTIVKNLMNAHDGSIIARSDGIGHGSEFEIRLPRARAAAVFDAPAAAPLASTPSATGIRVLVVDDNVDAAALLVDWLLLCGHDAQGVNHPREALRLAPVFRPDVALLDIGLPGMSGYDLARALRDVVGLKDLRLFALTGYGQLTDQNRSATEGFEGHLVKPVDLQRLKALINPGP